MSILYADHYELAPLLRFRAQDNNKNKNNIIIIIIINAKLAITNLSLRHLN
jgi:hypothetical protein